jgi:sterol desaturase/sphingolipid hydroxylase (fatty acid hydroxylase superfamily)
MTQRRGKQEFRQGTTCHTTWFFSGDRKALSGTQECKQNGVWWTANSCQGKEIHSIAFETETTSADTVIRLHFSSGLTSYQQASSRYLASGLPQSRNVKWDIVFEQKINEFFGDAESTGFGTGWWSGILSAFFGFLSFGGVLCLHFPQLLTSPELRPHYPMHIMRVLIQSLIVAAIFLGVISSLLRKKKTLALTGMLFAIAATALGGSSVKINETQRNGLAIGLDWFLLDLFLMALIYVPLERLWPRYPKQGTFRKEWTLDVVYFMSTHLPLQILSFLVLLPATQATKYLGVPVLQGWIARMPWILQFFLAIVVADVAEYFIHLALHKVPFLWRFHSIHHSSKALDWIAGSRSHFVDDTLVRGFILAPLMLGFSQSIILAYLIFVTLHATWTHCNFGPNATWLEQFLVMPRYHHWHHTSQKEGIDKNFAIHFPWIDKIFGTYYFPDKWPEVYGLDGEEISPTFLGQTIDPFIGKKR